MKCILLAGGSGFRLDKLTIATNKHLLPCGKQPVICYACDTLQKLGFKDVLVVTTPDAIPSFSKLISKTHNFRSLYFTSQPSPLGTAHAISLGEAFAGNEPIFVLLGDGLYDKQNVVILKRSIATFKSLGNYGAHVWVKGVKDARQSGVLKLISNRPYEIIEKPTHPKSGLVITGAYMFDRTVWEKIRRLTPSKRNELEVTDLLIQYLNRHSLRHSVLKGEWGDMGSSIEDYYKIATSKSF